LYGGFKQNYCACGCCAKFEDFNLFNLDTEAQMTYRASAKDRAKTQPGGYLVPAMPATFYSGSAKFLNSVLAATEPLEDWHKQAVAQDRFPHKCPKCGSPAYVGFSRTECSKGDCK
jgi:hypothetical protein